MANETSKALPRRLADPRFARSWFVGNAIDIGSGHDSLASQLHVWPLLFSVYSWDWPDGDAQELPGLLPETFQTVYSSHTLEHVRDPAATLGRWWEVLKPGGHMVIQVPDEDLYECQTWPSRWNPDHKSTFAVGKTESWSPVSHNIDEMAKRLPRSTLVMCQRLTEHYRYDWPVQDQTQGPAECAIEIVVRKNAD